MVSTPVLATKLYAPARRPQLVARPRLAERLSTTLDAGHRLTLLSAPPGFGKTTLLGDWLTELDELGRLTRVGWLSLDDGDNDLTRFATHLVAALQRAGLDVDAVVLESLSTAPTGRRSDPAGQRHRSSRSPGAGQAVDRGARRLSRDRSVRGP